MAAATEPSKEAVLVQSTTMSAKVVFINMGWKKSHHVSARLGHTMRLFDRTIADIVCNMKPAMICMSEGSESAILRTKEDMQQIADQVVQAWHDAATEHVELRCMFEVGEPYIKVYDVGRMSCSQASSLTEHAG